MPGPSSSTRRLSFLTGRAIYLRIPRPHVHYEANQEEHDEDEETDSGNLSRGKSNKSKPKGTRYQRNQKENQRVIQHDGTSFSSRDDPVNYTFRQLLGQFPSVLFSASGP
jgi:hypothetical protein